MHKPDRTSEAQQWRQQFVGMQKITNGPGTRRRWTSATGRSEETWRYLHWPFELCVLARGQHECVWQVFDADRAGCLRCAFIHKCSAETCRLLQTEEAMVCDVTGLCLVTKNFVQKQYSDCVAYQGSSTTSESSRIELNEVHKVVRHLLCSEQSTRCNTRLMNKFNSLLYHQLQHHCMQNPTETTNAIETIESGLHSVCQRIDLPLCMPLAETELLVDACAQEICTLMSICYNKLRLHIRPSDVQDMVVGLLFLMRTGITVHGVCVLPPIPRLVNLLPVENMLPKIFNLQCKTITDVENKIKMQIRQQSRTTLLAAGFPDSQRLRRRPTSLERKLSFLFPRPLDDDAS
jgi:hypothetical protein